MRSARAGPKEERRLSVSPFMLFLALVPSVILIAYIYKKDTVEKEPPKLLAKLFCLGALTTVSAAVAEFVLGAVALALFPAGSLFYLIVENFLVVAFSEEMGKFVVLKLGTWKSPQFNYLFDGVVYAVVVSLGFATLENVLYLLDGSVTTGIMRGLLSVPGHAIDGLFMGYFYGLAKRAEYRGNVREKKANLFFACFIPIVMHGFYDFYLSAGLLAPYFLFEIVVTVVAILHVRRLSKNDGML